MADHPDSCSRRLSENAPFTQLFVILKKQCSQYLTYGCAYFFKMPRLERKGLFSDNLLGILSDLSVHSGNHKSNNSHILHSASGVKYLAAQEKIFLFPLITFTPDRIYYTSGCLAGLTTKDGLTAVIFHHKCCWANGGHH